MRNEIGADVERADADDHGIKIFQAIRRQVSAGECSDFVTHLLQRVGHAVARTGNVADLLAANREVERDGFDASGWLE